MDEPKEGATTLKKKAQEKLAAKANPVSEETTETVVSTPAAEEAVVETPAVEVSEVPEEVTTTEAVVATPEAVETPAAEAAAE
jgi:small subunit ribosomal protein S16